MTERKSLSKKIRFEVFKRDSFTCQYCGSKAPDVILEVDHINPVSKGGDNNIINLITSCQICNRGKSDRKIDDNSIVEKQRRQIEELNVRRQQLEMMLAWRDGLTSVKEDSYNKAVEYWNKQWETIHLNENGKSKLKVLVDKYGIIQVLDAIDISVRKYKTVNESDSGEIVFNKIGGILALKDKPEITKKICYIKGICKNRFGYFDEKKASIILNEYIKALKNKRYDDDAILKDLDTEMIPFTKDAKHWSQWKNQIEDWIEDINNWK